jgi:hypothetical protein
MQAGKAYTDVVTIGAGPSGLWGLFAVPRFQYTTASPEPRLLKVA